MAIGGRAFNLLRASVRQQITHRAGIMSKPAKHELTAGEQAVGMLAMLLTILVPSGWILANLESYKKRP
ncbi:cytochrome c oxidase subunit 8B [Brachyhypopomus gauderio]|uniref:cytochrome c oxidase subunit 8B n=1 Tax=Brachyhypopomus gauderio TaxID=698409 RepID=UPI0040425962